MAAALPFVESHESSRIAYTAAATLVEVGLLDGTKWAAGGSALSFIESGLNDLDVPTIRMELSMRLTIEEEFCIFEWSPCAYSAVYLREVLKADLLADPALGPTFYRWLMQAAHPGRAYGVADANFFVERITEYQEECGEEAVLTYEPHEALAPIASGKALTGLKLAFALSKLDDAGRRKWGLLERARKAAAAVRKMGGHLIHEEHGVSEFLMDRGEQGAFLLVCWHEQDSTHAMFDQEFEHLNELEMHPNYAAGFVASDVETARKVAEQVKAILAWSRAMDEFLEEIICD